MSQRWFDDLADINPKRWLLPYKKTTVSHLLKMALFYHILGLGLMYAGSAIAYEIIEDYETPLFPVSLTSVITAGPIEEVFFFGLPFYLAGNHIYVLATGVFWSILHIFNTESFEITNLAYGNFLFTVPHLFFSLRTWISKKGWFAIAFHSAWNVAIFSSFCLAGLRECVIFNEGEKFVLDMMLIPVAASLTIIIYLLHLKMHKENYYRKSLIIAIMVFVAAEIPLIVFNFDKLF